MSRQPELAGVLTDSALRKAAGPTYYARGAAYVADGLVKRLRASEREVRAAVDGTQRYAVRLWVERKALAWSCTCPLGEEGEACKHVVATGLAWLAGAATPLDSSRKSQASPVETFLRAADKEVLVKLLVERAREDADFDAWLVLKAQRHGFRSDKAVRRAIDQALDLDGDLDYYGTPTFVAQAGQAAELLESMLSARDYPAAAELSEYALRLGFRAYEHIDDSDGGFGEVLSRIAGVHLRACAKGAMPGEQLADRLFALLLTDDWGVVSAPAYRRALGNEGRTRFAETVRREWSKLRELVPGSRATDESGRRYLLAGLMRDIAAASGDVDEMLAVEQRDLSHSAAFVRIAEILARARRHDEALEWAERGVAAFPHERSGALYDFLVAAYLRRKEHDRALAIRWSQFEAFPTLDAYDQLRKCATSAHAWPAWREQALALLSARAAKRDAKHSWGAGPSGVLVQIRLRENDLPAALAQARAGGCDASLWLRLAQACEAERPADAVEIYRGRLEGTIGRMNNAAYDEAAATLRKIGTLMRRQGQGAAFLELLAGVMTRHKAKRNLMQRLDRVAAEARKAGAKAE